MVSWRSPPSVRERRDPKPQLMHYVYLLIDKNQRIYIGYTTNLKRRLSEHKSGKSFWTRRLIDPQIYYFEAYKDEESAKIREKNLKRRGSAYQGLIKRIKLK